jgi:hypothetical protein
MIKFNFGFKTNAGLVCAYTDTWTLHIFVGPEFWTWGRSHLYYDGSHKAFCFGPLFLFTRVG